MEIVRLDLEAMAKNHGKSPILKIYHQKNEQFFVSLKYHSSGSNCTLYIYFSLCHNVTCLTLFLNPIHVCVYGCVCVFVSMKSLLHALHLSYYREVFSAVAVCLWLCFFSC